jgi:hypothetical protein
MWFRSRKCLQHGGFLMIENFKHPNPSFLGHLASRMQFFLSEMLSTSHRIRTKHFVCFANVFSLSSNTCCYCHCKKNTHRNRLFHGRLVLVSFESQQPSGRGPASVPCAPRCHLHSLSTPPDGCRNVGSWNCTAMCRDLRIWKGRIGSRLRWSMQLARSMRQATAASKSWDLACCALCVCECCCKLQFWGICDIYLTSHCYLTRFPGKNGRELAWKIEDNLHGGRCTAGWVEGSKRCLTSALV